MSSTFNVVMMIAFITECPTKTKQKEMYNKMLLDDERKLGIVK